MGNIHIPLSPFWQWTMSVMGATAEMAWSLLDKSYIKISARTADKVVSGELVLFMENANVWKRNESTFSLVISATDELETWCSNKTHQLKTPRPNGNWVERSETRNTRNEQNNQRASLSTCIPQRKARGILQNCWSCHCQTNVHVTNKKCQSLHQQSLQDFLSEYYCPHLIVRGRPKTKKMCDVYDPLNDCTACFILVWFVTCFAIEGNTIWNRHEVKTLSLTLPKVL